MRGGIDIAHSIASIALALAIGHCFAVRTIVDPTSTRRAVRPFGISTGGPQGPSLAYGGPCSLGRGRAGLAGRG